MGGRRKRAWETDTHWVTDYPVSREDVLLNSLWGVQRFPHMCSSIRERSVRETGITELWFVSYSSLFPVPTNFSKSKMCRSSLSFTTSDYVMTQPLSASVWLDESSLPRCLFYPHMSQWWQARRCPWIPLRVPASTSTLPSLPLTLLKQMATDGKTEPREPGGICFGSHSS